MLKVLDFKQYWDKKLVAWNKELIEEVSKELERYTEIFSKLLLQKIKNDLYDEFLGPSYKGARVSNTSKQKITSRSYAPGKNPSTQKMMGLIKEVASKLPHQEKTFTHQDSIEFIAIMHLKYNLRIIQTFLENKEQKILHPT